MANLLPDAGQHLYLRKHNDSLVPTMGEAPVTNVIQRMDILRKRYGQRFTDIVLSDLIRRKQPLPDTIELLVVRSGEIDSQLENNPEATLRLIHDTLKRIRFALHKLKQQGFHEAVIVSDHGFFLNMQAEAGDENAWKRKWISLDVERRRETSPSCLSPDRLAKRTPRG